MIFSRAVFVTVGMMLVQTALAAGLLDGKAESPFVSDRGHFTKSLNGRFAYVLREKYATSAEVVQINIGTGATKPVIDGNEVAVVRGGRYAGYLLVSRHRYRDEGGSYECVYVVRPDGQETFPITETKARGDRTLLELAAQWPSPEDVTCGGGLARE